MVVAVTVEPVGIDVSGNFAQPLPLGDIVETCMLSEYFTPPDVT